MSEKNAKFSVGIVPCGNRYGTVAIKENMKAQNGQGYTETYKDLNLTKYPD
jgi:hypothetical protein